MPRAAIATDAVDLVLSPPEIANELAHLGRHFRAIAEEDREPAVPMDAKDLDRIFQVLRNETGVDFANYKRPTIRRRLQRRMVVNKIAHLPDYVDLLSRQPSEIRHLYHDLLIHVTRFFREPESFDGIVEHIGPALLQDRPRESPIRVWVPGCSTGEEAYSVAIALLEFVGDRAATMPIQVFATDLAETAIQRARSGLYPENIAADVSPERLRRFFAHRDGGYRIRQFVRDLCVFARQDVTRDPPFSKLDLIVCRNLLIYLGPTLQQRLIHVFHYALKPRGFLMLGGVETVGVHTSLFELVDRRFKIFAKKLSEDAPPLEIAFHAPALLAGSREADPPAEAPMTSLQHRANALLLERYAPPAVLVDGSFQIVHARGGTGPFLELPPGTASLSILKMARDDLAQGLRLALQGARKTKRVARRENLRVRSNGSVRNVAVEIVPIRQNDGRPYYLVLFEEKERNPSPPPGKAPARRAGKRGARPSPDSRAAELEQELETTREHLQSMIHDLEAANEELQSANEEILSSNEELQSTNEELDTAREELQSTNEEINTVNEELQGRNEELIHANSDLVNLLGNVQLAIVIVSNDLRIRRFTPIAERVLNLIATDVGRPIGHIKPNIDCPDLESLIGEVVDRMTPIEREVQDHQGVWYSMRIRPYKNLENRIDGAVIALVDLTVPRRHAAEIRDWRLYEGALLDLTDAPMAALDASLRVRAVSRTWVRTLGRPGDEPVDRLFFELAGGVFDLPQLRALLQSALAGTSSPAEVRVALVDAAGGPRTVRVTARRIDAADPDAPAVVVQVEPVADDATLG
jgi:two-component system CheB/CheR fusion protein